MAVLYKADGHSYLNGVSIKVLVAVELHLVLDGKVAVLVDVIKIVLVDVVSVELPGRAFGLLSVISCHRTGDISSYYGRLCFVIRNELELVDGHVAVILRLFLRSRILLRSRIFLRRGLLCGFFLGHRLLRDLLEHHSASYRKELSILERLGLCLGIVCGEYLN